MKEIQEFVREQVIMSVYQGDECYLESEMHDKRIFLKKQSAIHGFDDVLLATYYQPITLSRVLNAIDPYGNYGLIAGHITKINRIKATYNYLGIKWRYLNKDGSEATFQDQAPETQLAIAKLLGYKA